MKIMKKLEFTKSDLKTGMLVQYRNGDVRIFINNCFYGLDSFISLSGHNSDMIYNNIYSNSDFDVMRVSNVKKENKLIPKYWTIKELNDDLLWERTPEKTFTIDDIDYSETTLRSLIKKATSNT